jgi:hypothetical protein
MQFQFGGDDLFHRTSLPGIHTDVNASQRVNICGIPPAPFQGAGLLPPFVELLSYMFA